MWSRSALESRFWPRVKVRVFFPRRLWPQAHRRRSDWNSGGTHGGTYYKSPAVEAKNTFSYIVMQVIWCLKFRNMTKSGGIIPHSKLWGGLVPPVPPPPWSTPMPGPYLFCLHLSVFCNSVFDFCTIYLTTKTVCMRLCTFIRRIYNFSQVILKYTIIMSHNKS